MQHRRPPFQWMAHIFAYNGLPVRRRNRASFIPLNNQVAAPCSGVRGEFFSAPTARALSVIRHSLLQQGILSLLLFLLCLITDNSATVAPISVKVCMTDIFPDRSSPFWGRFPRDRPNPKFWPFNRAYLENVSCSITCQLELKTSALKI